MYPEQESKPATNRTGLKARKIPAGLGAFFLLLILASISVFAVACGDDPTAAPDPTSAPEPTPTMAPEPTTAPEPEPTSAPEPTPTTAPVPTPTTAPEPTPTTAPVPTPTTAPVPTPSDDDLTMAYVQSAIDFYQENGLEATVALFRTSESIVDGRSLILLDVTENLVLVFRAIPNLEGQYFGPGTPFTSFRTATANAVEEGA